MDRCSARHIKGFLILTIIPFFFLGCASNKSKQMGQAAVKNFETRIVNAPCNSVFSAAIEALFDLGYQIKHSDKQSGIILGERQDARKSNRAAMALLFGWAAAASVRPIVYNLTVLVKRVDEKTSNVRIKTSIDGEPILDKKAIDKVWVYVDRQVLMESPYRKYDRAIAVNQSVAPPATQKQESKKQQIANRPSRSTVSGPEVIATDGSFEKYANGVVRDTRTGLEWVAGPDTDTTWDEARDWVQGLSIDGGGWRMPTAKELEGLYQEGKGYSNMTPLLKTTGGWVWSGETAGSSSSCGFNFTTGHRDRGRPCHLRHLLRGFAVRSQSAG